MQLGDTNNLEFYISYLTVANFAYIMRKLPADKLREFIRKMCETFYIVNNTKSQIVQNLKEVTDDIEDGLQYQTAVSARCDCLITRNKKDFTFSRIPVYNPAEFILLF